MIFRVSGRRFPTSDRGPGGGTVGVDDEQAEIRFLEFAGRRVAYAVTGDGPPLVAPAWWVSHLELDWRDPAFRGFWEAVGEGYRVVRYDRLGVGVSDREVRDEDLTLECDVALLQAVLDKLTLEQVVVGRRVVGRLRGRRVRGPVP